MIPAKSSLSGVPVCQQQIAGPPQPTVEFSSSVVLNLTTLGENSDGNSQSTTCYITTMLQDVYHTCCRIRRATKSQKFSGFCRMIQLLRMSLESLSLSLSQNWGEHVIASSPISVTTTLLLLLSLHKETDMPTLWTQIYKWCAWHHVPRLPRHQRLFD